MTPELIYLHYLTPIIVAYLSRLVWWVFFSPEDATFWPEMNDFEEGLALTALAAWPLTLIVAVSGLMFIGVFFPAMAAIKTMRAWRIHRKESVVNE